MSPSFTLTDADIPSKINYKMNPQEVKDLIALKEALRDGVIDVIARIMPSSEEKSKSLLEAPFGIVGLETAFALTNQN